MVKRVTSQTLRKVIASISLALCLTFGVGEGAFGATISVKAEPGAVAKAISHAAPGDVLELQTGRHLGPVIIDKTVTLTGVRGAVVDGAGVDTSITILAEDVHIRGLKVINSGDNLPDKNSGIFINKTAHRAVIEDNFLENNLISVYLWGADDVIVRNNKIYGRQDLRVNERGNGVQLWESDRSQIIGNDIKYGRDGIFALTSEGDIFRENTITETRFAVHYMYVNDSVLEGNQSRDNHLGYALMFSTNMQVRGNLSLGDRDHGIALNYANGSKFIDNQVVGVGDKCVFIYNSNKNIFSRNLFKGCGIGIHFTAGSERNKISENAFIANQTQVKYVGTRSLDWASEGRGNYWSDNPAFDLDGNGLADATYRPNDMVDRVVWAYPMSKLLLNSPAVQVLRWAQSTFPSIRPGGVYDSAPLMHPAMKEVDANG